MREADLNCPKCGVEREPKQYFDGVSAWWPWIEALQHECKACGEKEEIQIESGKVVLGYIYAAGTAHFSGMLDVPVPGVEVSRHNDKFEIRFHGSVWNVPVKT